MQLEYFAQQSAVEINLISVHDRSKGLFHKLRLREAKAACETAVAVLDLDMTLVFHADHYPGFFLFVNKIEFHVGTFTLVKLLVLTEVMELPNDFLAEVLIVPNEFASFDIVQEADVEDLAFLWPVKDRAQKLGVVSLYGHV